MSKNIGCVQLQAENLWVSPKYEEDRNRSILKGVSFSVYKGEILWLMGQSGCGKTVTALSLMGLLDMVGLKAVDGRILYKAGDENAQMQDLLKTGEPGLNRLRGSELSMISQNPAGALNPVVPVGKQLEQSISFYYKRKNGCHKISREFLDYEMSEVLRLSGLAEEKNIRNKYPDQLSVGMCQRVAIALGICGYPKLLIADEPTASLDYDCKDLILKELLNLREKLSMTILLITHDTKGCGYMADRVLHLKNGRIGDDYE